jgi:signal transduction histidine kinase
MREFSCPSHHRHRTAEQDEGDEGQMVTQSVVSALAGTTVARTEPDAHGSRSPRVVWGVRSRILLWYVILMSVATVASVLVVRSVLTAQVDQRIDDALVQELDELRRLVRGRDPATGQPFGENVERIFEVFLQRNIPARNEVHLTFVNNQPFLRSRQVAPYRLDRDAELISQWGTLTEAVRGRIAETPAGSVEYLAAPLLLGSDTRGVFVAAFFRDLELDEIDPATWGAAGVGLATLLVGSLLAWWRVAEGVLRPVREVTRTALSISEGELTRRIPVTARDEIATLATTFNEMLDRLEEAFATQRRFVDDAGHELRTPITVIRGHLELLEDDPDERRNTMSLVMDELNRMQRIVNDLLVLAKAEQPDFLDLDTIDIAALTEEVHAKAEAIAPREWRLESVGRGRVVADRQRLTQAIMQLAQNAAQHTENGAPIALGSDVANGEARLWVRDSGAGIPPEQQATIFRRFARGKGGHRSEGAGIGLAIVKAIAEAHHGRVEVLSRSGEGSTFTMVIPTDQPVKELR